MPAQWTGDVVGKMHNIAEEALFGGSKSTGKAEEKPAESEQGGFEEVEGDPNDLPF